ncbi:Trk system potassium transport protein TrkA [Leadbettera azotonutricia]|uniref:Trk system potassium uptake protein TrkA n=1 Tax=Leadbettera azotonutricia (strain ATCC BAA-888 / DSM 13862 / ZAS-9) TaxID=545695 RepID=F5YFU5_LEAAZ|nr:Trk system potassium transport protein TrkA [Leadbettera azotonutricia]AEF80723.1 Trk system potassium uptake protein TrkA [Leadbettera azotonutricia ZAS-9]
MRIVIVGAGLVGTQLAKHLVQEKHDVSIIESDEERARHASNHLDCMVIHDEGNSIKALKDAGIARADALVCVTDSDEVNMIICGLAASLFPDLLKIARVRNDDYLQLKRQESADRRILGIDHFIHPDVEASRSIINAIEHGALGDIISFSNTPYELGSIDVTPDSAFDGLGLKDYRSLVKEESLVTLVERNREVLLPSGSTVLAKGDRVHILANGRDMPRIFKFAGSTDKPIRKIGIVGGGKVGSLIAEGLVSKHGAFDKPDQQEKEKGKRNILFPLLRTLIPRNSRRIVIIEQDYKLCKELAARFPEALVLNEDISDESFVTEEQLDDLDLLITTTNNQELNIITAVYLKSRGIARTIAMVTGSGYAAMARQLGVDVVIPMKSVVVDSILSHLMGSGVKEVHRIGDGSVDIMEIEIGKDVPALDKPISDLKFSAGGLVMLVNRDGNSFIPRGDYIFGRGDRIVLIAKTGSQAEVEKFFGPT